MISISETIGSFNSSMVRLGGHNDYCAITTHEGFNSSMVRLGAI